MDIHADCNPDSFKKTLAKGFALNLAGTAGLFTGVAIIGTVLGAVKKRNEAKTPTAVPND